MKKNVGMIDRVARLIVGLLLITLVFVGPHTPWGWIGLILIATAGMSWCPLYRLFGFQTTAKDESSSHVL